MAVSIEELLAEALGEDSASEPPEEKTADSAVSYSSAEEELDLAEFVDSLHKSAAALQKLAEELPLAPELAARRLAMLDNPATVTRQELHDQFVQQMSTALPQAMLSNRVPGSIDEIQKVASGETGGLLRRILGRG